MEPDRLARRRASLLVALRDGDVAAAARAWSRLRIAGGTLNGSEATAARDLRAQLGRALRVARERRAGRDPQRSVATVAALSLPPSSPLWRVVRVCVPAAVFAALVALILTPAPAFSPMVVLPPLSPAIQAHVLEDGSRGRIEIVQPFDTALASAAPRSASVPAVVRGISRSFSPSPAFAAGPSPSPTARPGVTPSPTPSGTPLVTSTPVVLPNSPGPVASPSPPLLPPTLAFGFSRIRVLVVDAATLRPISGACIVLGNACDVSGPHTNALGLWWIDLATGSAAGQRWTVTIEKDGYEPLTAVVITTGASEDFVAPLQPLR